MEVQAIESFEHNGRRARGVRFHVSDQQAEKLLARRLVKIVPAQDTEVPPPAAGNPSSASPAAPVSRQRTRRRSAAGVRRTPQAEPSSS